ncbi:putative disease resistance RPP13-like protein 1 [Vitis vinifera]|uniref:Putative disease resistance RPP13-like protein 1 n=1 Tax=Vitis vinifera TaxID=29760 RepID=A0A438DZ69_VITVI|nr:putative disease resistance RPP13-like protein 1 [Vitis vinifera]
MVDLNLNHCKNCISLSSLGQLSSLKSLCIAGMGGLKRVGAEFYGEISPSVRPFSSLETLIFEDMPEWKNWSFPCMVEEVGAFHCLRQLTLINCPKLIKLPCHPPSLVELAVCECAELAIPLRRLASVDKLSLTGCCRAHLSTRDGVDLSSLINTFIQELPSLTCREELKQFLEILNIWRYMTVLACRSCQMNCRDSRSSQLTSATEIEHCVNLESLPKGMMQDASINPSNTCRLQVLKLYRCSSLRSFPAGEFPSTLKRLEIWDCTQLDGISEKMLQNNSSLEFPISSHAEPLIHSKFIYTEVSRLTSLTGLRIGGLFPDVVPFSVKQGFPLLPTTLTHLSIDRIQNLESLVSLGLQNLTSLKELRFTECLKLHSFLPSEGLPSTVSMLFIRNCPLLSRSRETVLEMKNSLSNGFSLLSFWHVLTLKKMLLEALSHTFNGMPASWP